MTWKIVLRLLVAALSGVVAEWAATTSGSFPGSGAAIATAAGYAMRSPRDKGL